MPLHALTEERFERQAIARPEELAPMRTAVWRHALALGASSEIGDAVRLAVGEALTNVVMHAYVGRETGKMTVEAWLDDDDHLTIRVLDEGHGLIPRTDSPGLGLGIGVMAQMSDDFRVANREGKPGTSVSMRFSLESSASKAACGGAVA
jgi:serine/threonine-protein kinase RsbW/stage II sporulation protein AB (anti-sigma F factor)